MTHRSRKARRRNSWRVALPSTALAIAVMFGGSGAHAQDVPVMLQDNGEDACGYGAVTGLNPNGDGFLAVRRGPSTGYEQIDSVYNDDPVAMCDRQGAWIGIVYGGEGCAAGSPPGVTQNGPYQGPCRSGWVSARYVRLIAG